eukprot:447978_1
MSSSELRGYKIQQIIYRNQSTHRIQQDTNGACPLIALMNTLFLNNQINYTNAAHRISFDQLTDCLTRHLTNMLNTESQTATVKTELGVDTTDITNLLDINNNNSNLQIRQIQEFVALFPTLEQGLDMNIKFSGACDFEQNPGYRMFSAFGFKLFHGCVVNPKDNSELFS